MHSVQDVKILHRDLAFIFGAVVPLQKFVVGICVCHRQDRRRERFDQEVEVTPGRAADVRRARSREPISHPSQRARSVVARRNKAASAARLS